MPTREVARSMPDVHNRPTLRGVSHEVAAFLFPLLGGLQIAFARTGGAKVADGVYVAGVTGMYASSATYHRGKWTPPVRRKLRRLDHSMILVGIASTYTAVAGVGLPGTSGKVVVATVWSLALAGALIRNLWLDAPSWLTAAVYMGVGWVALGVLPALWTHLGAATFVLVVSGGVVYSLGAAVFARRRPDPVPQVFGYHEVFHALVLTAGALFYIAIWRIVVHA